MTHSHIAVRPITAAETKPLRHSVLRPHQPIESLVYRGDDAPDSLHVGAFLDSELVGIASVSRESLPGEERSHGWRLRGMATAGKVQGMGYGRALLEACVAHVRTHGGDVLWCNGRTSALPFYRAMGFETRGDEYESPEGTGPHYVLVKQLVRRAPENF